MLRKKSFRLPSIRRQQIVESYRRPKMTEEDIRRGAYLEIKDPVKEFGEACRKELNQLYRAAS
jgi:hypothetical protein